MGIEGRVGLVAGKGRKGKRSIVQRGIGGGMKRERKHHGVFALDREEKRLTEEG